MLQATVTGYRFGEKTLQSSAKTCFVLFFVFIQLRGRNYIISTEVWSRLQKRPPCKILQFKCGTDYRLLVSSSVRRILKRGGGGGGRNFRKFENKDQNKKLFHSKSVRFFAQNLVKSKKKGLHSNLVRFFSQSWLQA